MYGFSNGLSRFSFGVGGGTVADVDRWTCKLCHEEVLIAAVCSATHADTGKLVWVNPHMVSIFVPSPAEPDCLIAYKGYLPHACKATVPPAKDLSKKDGSG
jgi:hypothetical protein